MLADALHLLEQAAEPGVAEGMPRFGITTADRVIGIKVGTIRGIARAFGRDQALAEQLWDAGIYEARLLACFVGEPSALTAKGMDRWAAGFDNWATCDTACFDLFDKSPLAWDAVSRWAGDEREFVRRGAFALLAGLALHAKKLPDQPFLATLPLIEAHAGDDRNFVKKGVSWALRAIGMRNPTLHHSASELAERLSAVPLPAARWIGRDAARDLARPAARRKAGLG
ncbi:3-methyladenine DNA glycosylase AlkD [Sphingomonas kyeonggiensis]|uniref:3-methyladenine DNA glycosylase AlkD n=1 Tax=Sphingomonas kyeonggiensis TaxID=1268553 RepID=A0A7W7JZZ0_9SPHN|nr:DNA alkylation repair protein [Sphingomonas kyeonggiensis]MBB4838168.1 3-methyladenine DNA glycosylase AlkD [Sphingomonas kyeonggiensis]